MSVWMMRLGIRLTHGRLRHPQTQGKVERMHGSLQAAVRLRRTDPENQAWLDTFREEYNHIRPHEALEMEAPASRWCPSARPLPAQVREWEYEPNLEVAQLGCDGQLGWRGRRWEISNALRRLPVGIEVMEDRAIVYFCRTPMRELDLRTGKAVPLPTKAPRSLPD